MKSRYFLFAILAAALITFQLIRYSQIGNHIYANTIDNEFVDDQVDDLEQSVNQMHATASCSIGSGYILGRGCSNGIFQNNYYDASQTRQRSVIRQDITCLQTTRYSDALQLIQKRNTMLGGGWGKIINKYMDSYNKIQESVNTVSLALVDYRRYYYKEMDPQKIQISQDDLALFVEDPVSFFKEFGYYYVQGYTTGSSFEGSFKYNSENRDVLLEISRNPNSPTDNFQSKSSTKYGSATFSQNQTMQGFNNFVIKTDDVLENYRLYQQNLNQDEAVTVTIFKYVNLPQFSRELTKITDPEILQKLKTYKAFQEYQFTELSKAYSLFEFVLEQVSQHIRQLGVKLSTTNPTNLKQLNDYRIELDNKKRIIEDLIEMDQLCDKKLYIETLLDSQRYCESVMIFLKRITGRWDGME